MKNIIFFAVVLIIASCDSSNKTTSGVYSIKPVIEATPFAPGIITTEENSEFHINFTPDGKKAYFTRRAPGQKQKIYETDFINGNWSVPTLCSFSTDRDETPSISPDGNYFFFGSERPIPGKPNKGNFDINVWMMKKTTTGWGKPTPLLYPINDVQKEGEEWPICNSNLFYSIDNETYYYATMMRGNKSAMLYEIKYDGNIFSEPKLVSGLFDDEKYWVNNAVISPDGEYLIFNSFGLPNGEGGEDIYISKRTTKGWSKAISIGPKVNSKNEESGAAFSRDGKYFFFSRTAHLGKDEYGESNIMFIETEHLQLAKLFK